MSSSIRSAGMHFHRRMLISGLQQKPQGSGQPKLEK
jgi:hypothetical protein